MSIYILFEVQLAQESRCEREGGGGTALLQLALFKVLEAAGALSSSLAAAGLAVPALAAAEFGDLPIQQPSSSCGLAAKSSTAARQARGASTTAATQE
jgi:hypothetical protein